MLPSLRRPASSVCWWLLPASSFDRRRRLLLSSSSASEAVNDDDDDASFIRAHPPRAIDVHTHMYPPASYMKLLRSRVHVPRVVSIGGQDRLIILPGEEEETTTVAGRPIGDEYWSLDRKLQFMDRHGIHASVVSLANPWVDFLPPRDALRVAAEVNDELQKMSELSHRRIFGFGAVAAHAAREDGVEGVKAVVRELERVASMQGMRGVILGAHELDHPGMEPIYEACSRLGLTIFLHPHYGLGEGANHSLLSGYGHVLPLALGFPFETTIAVSRLILSGALDRHPALTCLLAHAGGAIPFLAGRLDSCLVSDTEVAARIKLTPSEYLRRNFVYDGVIYHRPALEALLGFLGPENRGKVVFGTDHPFFPPKEGARAGESLWPSATKNMRILWDVERGDKDMWEGVMWRNASRLLRIPIHD